MSTVDQTQIDIAYQTQRLRLSTAVTAAVAAAWAQLHLDRQATIEQIVRLVEAGQSNTVRLVDAYLTAATLAATGRTLPIVLNPALYTTSTLRGIAAALVYSRPFGAYGAFLKDGAHLAAAIAAALASVSKLAATDLQLAHTRATRDWMQQAATRETTDAIRIVGYRRVLAGPGPHCKLCEAASTRTYRISDLLPIHEHCTCGVQPLYGTEPVASLGTTVRVENDPELGPRLMADDWSSVGRRLIEYDERGSKIDRQERLGVTRVEITPELLGLSTS